VNRVAIVTCLAVGLCACATPPKPAGNRPLTQACAEVARKLENGSGVDQDEKRELVESLRDYTFHWKLRVLSLSDETSHGELANGMAFNVECADRPGTTKDGMRYVFTLYFERQVAELAKLGRGAFLTVDGNFIKYEGQGAFAAKATAYKIDEAR
jgi:hypothetical protein